MAVGLRERAVELQSLEDALVEAEAGHGSVVLLSGEAGIGKSSVLRAFLRSAGGRARLMVGACDDLLSPRAFGPLHDVVHQVGPLADALAAADREAVFTAVTGALSRTPAVLAVEDAHWADEPTLDVLRHVGRRIVDLPAVLVITYRADEIGAKHPPVPLLGALAGGPVRRIVLPSLSQAAVASMVEGTGLEPAAVHQLTAGNPFFVSEVLASGGDGVVPATVVDAVLARVRRLDLATQRALEQLSVVPSAMELPLARALLPDLALLAEAERSGILEVEPRSVRFRHELARRAVAGALPASSRMQLNAAVLAVLRARDVPDLARVVHHAVEAADDEAVVTSAPQAAAEARSAGALGAAATLFEHALARRALLDPAAQADLLESYASTLFSSDRPRDAIDAAETAVELRKRIGDDVPLGQALATLAMQQWADLYIEEALISEAADAWAKIGAPYERALELVDSAVPEAMLEGLSVLDGLGAAPAAALVRHRLRGLGHTQVPRGPQAGTRTNPAGLTGRQLEILRLLSAGLTNAEIAARLVLSVRTVDHHVSAVLQKLGVSSRAEAAVVALGLGR